MKTPFLLIAAIPLLALSSCSSVKATMAKAKNSTSKTFRAAKNSTGKALATAKEKTLGPSKPKLRLTKADPSRFLPQDTSAERILIKATPTKPSKKETHLLAKNTQAKAGPRPPEPTSKKTSPPSEVVVADLPPIELPPLPATSENDSTEFRGILPSLDGSNDATFIDIDGKALELPPMEMPVYQDEAPDEIDPEKSA